MAFTSAFSIKSKAQRQADPVSVLCDGEDVMPHTCNKAFQCGSTVKKWSLVRFGLIYYTSAFSAAKAM